ncbi:MAG: adenylate/guanylate cyclase domain-containing protein, partial [Boseongicola sp.]
MSGNGQNRRLAAIVAADVAGYSRLMGLDEERTVQTLRTYRTQVVDPLLEKFGGRIANTAGDSLLIEFPSAVEAVRCSLEFQSSIEQRNDGLPNDERVVFRIGINVGDVIADGGDLLGDGVNVAARLEGVSEPGGIVLSRSARDQVRDRLDIDLEDLGEIELKNIARPVRAFRVGCGQSKVEIPQARPNDAAISGPIQSSTIVRLGAVFAVIILAAIAIWSQIEQLTWDSEPKPGASVSSPDRTSIAILPFDNLGGDPGQVYFADGITEDLITDLSKISGLLVISRNSSFTLEARNASIEDVAQAFGVRFVLKGSVRYSGKVLRVNAQLVDGETGGTVWGQRFDRDRQEVFQMQDDITTSIVNALEEELLPGELEKLKAKDTTNVAAHDTYLRGLALYRRGNPADNAAAAEALRRSISLDPEFVQAKTTLAKVYVQAAIGPQAFASALDIHWSEGLALAWALLGQPESSTDADRHVVRSWLALRKHQHERAIEEAQQALELEPSDTEAMEALAEALIYSGQTESALEWAERALRHN